MRALDRFTMRSENRSSGSPENFSFAIPFGRPLIGKYVLEFVQIPNTIYNIDSTNNQVYFEESGGGGTLTGSITAGFYDTGTFPAAVKAAMDAVTANAITYTVSINADTNLMTITPSGGTVAIQFGTNTSNSAAQPMGFSASDVATAASVTGDQVIDLSEPRTLGIIFRDSDDRSSTRVSTGRYYSAQIPVNVSFGDVIFQREEDLRNQLLYFTNPVSILEVELINIGTGNVVDLNGLHWSFCLRKI